MKNYYELLEVSQSASQEVIEKAYKTLAKKYHPDLQDTVNKKDAEQKMKEINEAYDIISNPEKRNAYNQELEKIEQTRQEQFQNYYKEEIKHTYNNKDNYKQSNYNTIQKQEQQFQNDFIKQQQIQNDYIRQQEQIQFELEKQQAIEKAYYDAYIQDLKNRGYRIKYKKTFKDYIKNIVAIFIVIFILFLILQIPFVKNYFIRIYEENELIKWIVDLFVNTLKKVGS